MKIFLESIFLKMNARLTDIRIKKLIAGYVLEKVRETKTTELTYQQWKPAGDGRGLWRE